jgi:hypothetical protein
MAQLRYVLLAVTLVVLVGVSAVAVNVPNAFVAGEVISAAEMNANFAALEAAVAALEGSAAALEANAAALEAAQPVVAHAAQTSFVVDSTAVAQDVVVVSIEAPAAGVVIVTATAQAGFSGTTESNRIAFAIDDVAGGALTGNEAGQFIVGSSVPANAFSVFLPVAIQRAFEVEGGTHAFRLEAKALGADGTKYLWSPTITATWYPEGSASISAAAAAGSVAPLNAP